MQLFLLSRARCFRPCHSSILAGTSAKAHRGRVLSCLVGRLSLQFAPSAQGYADGPRLGNAAARCKWSVAVRDFAECPQPVALNLSPERLKVAQRRFPVSVDSQVR